MKKVTLFIKRNYDKIQKTSFYLSLISILFMVYDYGFMHTINEHNWINYFYEIALFMGIVSTILRHIKINPTLPVKIFDLLSVLFFCYVLIYALMVHGSIWAISVFLVFVREFSSLQINYGKRVINPAKLFIYSFLVIVILGALLLMLPKSTTHKISLLDALFTSTSAVCVTGLSTLNVAEDFTILGKGILLFLIQIGGLGIMTFASYFSYFFRGVSSFQNQLTLGEFTNNNNLGEVYSTIRKIIFVTLAIEMVGAAAIYFGITDAEIGDQNRLFFSIFHSISAFCNAGFSTLDGGLYAQGVRFDYDFQFSIAWLVILGGLGFPIVFNLVKLLKQNIKYKFLELRGQEIIKRKPWLLNINSRITLITSGALLLLGFVTFFVFEYNGVLKEYGFIGKLAGSFFGAVTPRTAGFNTIDMAKMSFPTIMIYFLLMWIGASPASTGGGIKTSTFAVAILNFMSLAKGKNRIEVYRREVSDLSVRRAFATIMLSLLVIGLAICIMVSLEQDKGLLSIAFECFSAYSTVGLSLGITGGLTSLSKGVLILLMFIGRVSMLTILLAVVKKEKYRNYKYPTEDIIIN